MVLGGRFLTVGGRSVRIRRRMFLRFLVLSLLLIIVGQTPLIQPVRNLAATVVSPLQYGSYQLSQSLRRELNFWTNLRSLPPENQQLSQRILQLESQLAELTEVERENEVLRSQLEIGAPEPPQNLLLAKITGRSRADVRSELIIDQGTAAGVRQGSVVIQQNLLLGVVVRVEKHRAVVRLTTDPEFRAAALTQGSDGRARGLVRGQFGTKLLLEKVLPDEPLKVGDTVITSGEDGKFSKGLILGKISRILGQEVEVFKSAEVDLMVDVNELEEVFIIK